MTNRDANLIAEFKTDASGRVTLTRYDDTTFTVSHWTDSIESTPDETAVFEKLSDAHQMFLKYVDMHLQVAVDLENQEELCK